MVRVYYSPEVSMKKALYILVSILLVACSESNITHTCDDTSHVQMVRVVIENNTVINLLDENGEVVDAPETFELARLMVESGVIDTTKDTYFELAEGSAKVIGHTHKYVIQDAKYIDTHWHPLSRRLPDGSIVYDSYQCNIYRMYYECEAYLGNGSYCGNKTTRITHTAQ